MRPLQLVPLAAALSLAACSSGITIDDDINTNLTFFGPAFADFNGVHSPYVQGATMGLYAEPHGHDDGVDMSQWKFVSSNPAVFSVVESQAPAPGGVLGVTGSANSAGTATVSVLDARGETVVSQLVTIKVPDQVKVEAHGPLIIGESDDAATVTAPQLVAGGEMTFLIRWFAGGVELNGSGALSATASDGLEADARTSEFDSTRDWLTLTAPATPGPSSVVLSAGGVAVSTMPVSVVDESAVAQVAMLGQDESKAKTEDWLAVLALANDASGQPIYGATFSFTVDSEEQEGLGDIYRYQYEPGTPKTLVASMDNGMTSSALIHAGTGFVDSDNDVGCNSSGPAGSPQLLALVGMVGLAAWKRRRATSSSCARAP